MLSEFKSTSRYFNSSNKINLEFEESGEIDVNGNKKNKGDEEVFKEMKNNNNLKNEVFEDDNIFKIKNQDNKILKVKKEKRDKKEKKEKNRSFKMKNINKINNKEKMVLTSAFDNFENLRNCESIEFKENHDKLNNKIFSSLSPEKKNNKLFQNKQLMSINKENVLKTKKNKLKKKYLKKLTPNLIGLQKLTRKLTNQSNPHFLSLKKNFENKKMKKKLNNRSFKQIKGGFNYAKKLSFCKKKKKILNSHSKTYLINNKKNDDIF